MIRPFSLMLVVGAVASVAACGRDASSSCEETLTCAVGDAGGTPEAGIDKGDAAPAPAGCDANADVKVAEKCVVDEFGVFVDAQSGSEQNPGTKALPVKSIGAALTKLGNKRRVYVCEGTYAEAVKLTSGASLYGGFACGTWTHTAAKVQITPADVGFALSIEKVDDAVVISDVELTSKDATEAGASSIAVFVSESKDVLLRRVAATAGKGKDAADAAAPATNLFSANVADLQGTPATGATGGAAKTCACKVHGSSTGGKGGNGGNPAEGGGAGSASPAATVTGGRTSAGGAGYPDGSNFACGNGKPGPDGTAGLGGKKSELVGALTANGWTPSAGSDGEAGNAGAGGGGGGGGDSDGAAGGGCGGCGGAGGVGGRGGGASIAVAVIQSAVRLEAAKLVTASAGKGGKGSAGEVGGPGGGGALGACNGGRGGNGAGGSGGAGGAGGISAGVVRAGGTFAKDGATTISLGSAGAPGGGGEAGAGGTNALGTAPAGAAGAPGLDGVTSEVLELAP